MWWSSKKKQHPKRMDVEVWLDGERVKDIKAAEETIADGEPHALNVIRNWPGGGETKALLFWGDDAETSKGPPPPPENVTKDMGWGLGGFWVILIGIEMLVLLFCVFYWLLGKVG